MLKSQVGRPSQVASQPRPQITSALKTLDTEISGVLDLRNALSTSRLGDDFARAVDVIASAKGRVIVTGIGKSGHVGRKIAATFCSTGTPALFLHPGEASHGDLGVISGDDVVLAVTWSGNTTELSDVLGYCRVNSLPLIVVTAHAGSVAGKAADICLALPAVREACPNELAPTTSTTVQLVIGDALAVALIEARGFSSHSFRLFHPGGRLGAQLVTVGELMGTGDALPRVPVNASLRTATIEMSLKRYGCTAVVDDEDRIVGAFTDGDLRRSIVIHDLDDTIGQHMSPMPVTVDPSMLSRDALALMNSNAVSVLFVAKGEKLVGIIHIHDLVRLGIG
ncbi:MAG: KpsF/GutQ family sugar-phosphate isomerase [Alteraurantiacibacter sp.]